jgi:hypothetical protein
VGLWEQAESRIDGYEYRTRFDRSASPSRGRFSFFEGLCYSGSLKKPLERAGFAYPFEQLKALLPVRESEQPFECSSDFRGWEPWRSVLQTAEPARLTPNSSVCRDLRPLVRVGCSAPKHFRQCGQCFSIVRICVRRGFEWPEFERPPHNRNAAGTLPIECDSGSERSRCARLPRWRYRRKNSQPPRMFLVVAMHV